MSRTKILALTLLAVAVPFALAFTALRLSRTIGPSNVPAVPGLVEQKHSTGKTGTSRSGGNESPGDIAPIGQAPSASQVSPIPTDDRGGRGSGDSDSSGPGGGDDSGESGSSGSGGSDSSGNGSGSGDD